MGGIIIAVGGLSEVAMFSSLAIQYARRKVKSYIINIEIVEEINFKTAKLIQSYVEADSALGLFISTALFFQRTQSIDYRKDGVGLFCLSVW